MNPEEQTEFDINPPGKQEVDSTKAKGLTRRDFLRRSAIGLGAVAVLSSPISPFLKKAKLPPDVTSHNPSMAAAGPDNKARSWCMVVDLNKCEGCVTIGQPPQCTQACINGHFVPQGQQWIQVFDVELPGGGNYPMPTPCFQCENAPCVNVCPVAATYQDESGVVLIDHNRCIGCRMCMAACPYQRRFFNWGTPTVPSEAALSAYSPLYPVPAKKGTVIKCMFCAHMLRDGKLPLCVQGCPMKALYIGDLNENVASNGSEVVVLSNFLNDNSAYRYKEYLGTQPRVYYLPGYGQKFGRASDDKRPVIPPVWSWGGDGFAQNVSIWPWGKK